MYKNKQLFKFSTKNLSPTTEGFNAQAAVGGQVNAIKSGNNTVVIGNSYLSRMFVTDSNGKLRTYQLKNSRANTTCTPASGSEEFIIQLSAKKKSWNIIGVDSEEKTSENGAASNVLDGDISTIWHTRYNPTIDPYPHYIVIDLGAQTQISGFSYTPRQFGDNGNIKDYEFYISNDQNNFGTAVSKGTFQYKGVEPINVGFSTTVTGRYIKLIGKNAVNGQSFAACANIEILGPNTGSVKNDIKCSDLTLNDIVISNTEDDNGKIVKFYFKPFTFQEDIYTIVMNVVMKNDHHFMKKYLELKVDGFNTSINYIDLESLVLDSTVTQRWFRPEMEPAYISSYHIALGQPIYIQGMFLGCEFPQTDNRILNNVAFLRYFSGKKFKDLRKTSDGRYKTWKTVLGAARSTDMAVIQTDFFQYINTIAIKSDFRKQYNSWYDFMMNITSTNIVGSFYQIEKGLTQFGVDPLDCYVVDDGWNNYDKSFWEFNSKFPRELYDSMELATKFSSTFGLWHGPRGGYNYNSKFGKQMEAAGTGGYNPASDDVCTGHTNYIDKMIRFFIDYENKFQISYWKLDGFNLSPCPITTHGHMNGGSNSMFFTTEHWENWINVFTAMRKAREIQGKSLYINMTSYAVPSPWFLQWVEAVWLQNSNDVNFTGGMVDNSMMDAMINYRDDRYFDFVQTRQFQFPLANIYNHDPIYGNENFYNGSLVTMTTAQFEKYLYMIMTRGTGFWELYYSYNMFDNDKWMVNAEVLKWGQKNFSILRNAKLIGKTPNGGNVYGYSAWNGSKGIVSLRNPSSTAKTFTFTLDRLIGVGEGSTSLVRTTVYPYGVLKDSKTYNYGESITVTLQPYAVYIWQFGVADTIPAKVKVIKAITVNTVNVEFNERVLANKANYSVQGNVITNATILWDRRTVQLTLQNPLVEGTQYTLNLNNVSDLSNNMTTTSVTFKFYNNNQILKVSAISDLNNTTGLTSTTFAGMSAITFNKNAFSVNSGNSVSGVGDFTLSAIIKTVDRNTTILYQGSEYSLNINSTGNVEFNCKGILVVSKATINNNNWVHITALRERNGMVKIYINGTLDSSSYDATKTEENISSGTVMVGGTNFSGSISNLIITNVALGFDRIQSNAKAVGLN